MSPNKNNFKKIKEHLQAQPGLYIAGVQERPTNNIKKFMELLFKQLFLKERTLYLNHKEQTGPARRRSFGDIYRVMYHYFPKITVSTVYNILYELIAENMVVSAFCTVTKTRVYRATKPGEKGWVNSTLTDEYGTDIQFYTDKYGCLTDYSGGWGSTYNLSTIETVSL